MEKGLVETEVTRRIQEIMLWFDSRDAQVGVDVAAVELASKLAKTEQENTKLKQQCEMLANEIENHESECDELYNRIDELLTVIRYVEWVHAGNGRHNCPWCGGYWGVGHESDCSRQAAIANAEGRSE